jgi:hypothetical protein
MPDYFLSDYYYSVNVFNYNGYIEPIKYIDNQNYYNYKAYITIQGIDYTVDTELMFYLSDKKFLNEILSNEDIYVPLYFIDQEEAFTIIEEMKQFILHDSYFLYGDYKFDISTYESKDIAMRNMNIIK